MSKVKVTLAENAYVGGKLCAKGEEVEVRADLADIFSGKPAIEPETLESLLKLSKADLVVRAAEKGIETVPDSWTKEQIAKAILGGE